MLIVFLSSIMALAATDQSKNPSVTVSIRQLAYSPDIWVDRIVHFCGSENPGSDFVFTPTIGQDAAAVKVRPDVPRQIKGNTVCVIGRLVRKDGLTGKEAIKRGLPFHNYTDVGYNPDYEVANVR